MGTVPVTDDERQAYLRAETARRQALTQAIEEWPRLVAFVAALPTDTPTATLTKLALGRVLAHHGPNGVGACICNGIGIRDSFPCGTGRTLLDVLVRGQL